MYDQQMQLPPGFQYNPYTRVVERVPMQPQAAVDYTQFGQAKPIGMLPGRYIDTDRDIRANEVPMDGSVSYFPTKDFNTIIAKAWSSNGNIQTEIYQRVTQQQPEQVATNTEALIMEKLNSIERMLMPREVNDATVRSKNDFE